MLTDISMYVYITFYSALIFVLVIFYFASSRNIKLLSAIFLWGILHSMLALSGFYENTKTIPPRFTLLIFPLFVITIAGIFSIKAKSWFVSLNLKKLTYLHTVRIPVELALFGLYSAGHIPELMTFAGRNFDIIAGITAPVVAILGFRGGKVNKSLLWIWNVMSIILLINILVNAVLSVPTIVQQFAFNQPNTAVLYFPFVLLPAIIVQLVFLAHIAGFVILKKLN